MNHYAKLDRQHERIQRAANFLDARRRDDGRWGFWEYEPLHAVANSRYLVVDDDDLFALCRYLDDPREAEPYEAWLENHLGRR